MKIGITYDLRSEYLAAGYSEEQTAELDREDTIEAIDGAIRKLGHQTERIGNAKSLVQKLAAGARWELVFNIAEGLSGLSRESQVPAILDVYDIPYTFSDPLVLGITLHKGLAKRVVHAAGVPTPAFAEVSRMEDVARVDLPLPLFVKPIAEGTSKGVSAKSIIRERGELAGQCAELLEKFRQPVLVEEYLPGRELTVGIVGTGAKAEVIGSLEVVLFANAEQGVYSYGNKKDWEDVLTYQLGNAARDDEVRRGEAVALWAWRVLGCRDAGRVDIRSDAAGNPCFIEVNPLAGLNPEISDLAILCRKVGLAYDDLIARIVDSARERL